MISERCFGDLAFELPEVLHEPFPDAAPGFADVCACGSVAGAVVARDLVNHVLGVALAC